MYGCCSDAEVDGICTYDDSLLHPASHTIDVLEVEAFYVGLDLFELRLHLTDTKSARVQSQWLAKYCLGHHGGC